MSSVHSVGAIASFGVFVYLSARDIWLLGNDKQGSVDKAFMDIFLPLRKEMSDQEVIAVSLWLVPRTPSLFKRLASQITGRPLPDPNTPITLDEAATIMGVSRQTYNEYLMNGIKKVNQNLKQPSDEDNSYDRSS